MPEKLQTSADAEFTADEIMAEYEKDLMEDESFRNSELEKHPHLLLPEIFNKSYSKTLNAGSPDRTSEKLSTSEKALLEIPKKSSREMSSTRDKSSKSASATSELWLLEAKSSKKSFRKSGKSSSAAAIFPEMSVCKPATVTSASSSAALEADIPSSFPALSRNLSGN